MNTADKAGDLIALPWLPGGPPSSDKHCGTLLRLVTERVGDLRILAARLKAYPSIPETSSGGNRRAPGRELAEHDAGQYLGPARSPYQRLDALDKLVACIDIDAGILVSKWLFAHLGVAYSA